MNLTNLLTEPYVIAILCSLVLTLIVYLFLRETPSKKIKRDKKNNKIVETTSMSKKILITFVSSLLGFLAMIYGFRYLSTQKKNSMIMTGGSSITPLQLSAVTEKLNFADSDVEFGFYENS